jgi:putative PIN family toxin of toxin-antitoxin system
VRVVLDTSVLVSGILSPSGAAGAVLERARQNEFEVVCSPALLAEFEEVLGRLMSSLDAAAARGALEDLCHLVEPAAVPSVSRDPDDDHILAAAVSGGATYLITRDKDLLSLKSHSGIEILEPGTSLRRRQ